MTRTTAIRSVSPVASSEARIVALRSPVSLISMPPGSAAVICGSAAFTASIVSMTLAPGCL